MPIDFMESNTTLNPAKGDEDKVIPIRAYQGPDAIGNPTTVTVWQPSKEDIEAIKAGRQVVVSIAGYAFPPMMLYTVDESGAPNV